MREGNTLLTFGQSVDANAGLLAPGQVVAGYRVEGRAGAGGMGVVYRAVDVELGRLVALKVIAPEFAQDERFRELFKQESRKAAALEHPNVIPIYRSGEEDGLLYIAMRFVDGASLQELIHRRGRLPVGAAVRIVSQVADALDAAHAHGLVHRDVKPGNVLVADASGEEHVYLTDFGLSVPIAHDRAAGEGRYAGTPAYLSPEQIRGAPVDARTDVYALGCVLFHALTGSVPFAATGFEAKLVAHLTASPPKVTSVVPGLPGKLDDVVRQAMAKRSEDRFASAGELAAAARAARSDVVICHHADDAEAARSLADRLAGQGLDARLATGDVADDLWSAHACLLLVGRSDLADWARDVLAAASDIASVDPRYLLVSVLLPGSPEPFDADLAFLASHPFVDLRAGLDDPHATADLLRAVDATPVAVARPGAADACPYRGLEAFQEDDAELFFGRQRETALLAAKLRTSRFLAVLGASGSGKSSLVRAGLLPALRAAGPVEVALLTPGQKPLASLAAQLEQVLGTSAPSADEFLDDPRVLDTGAARVAARDGHPRLVVMVDQFEETFSLNPNPREQRAFIDSLVYAATIPGGSATVVLAMRSDFYHRCADHLALRALIAEQQFLVGPLGAEGLRQAIEEPARQVGLDLERGLVRRILTDVSDQPGALPLMEHLLLELWRRRRGRMLTLEAYTASGGVAGALAKRANEAYGSLDPAQQTIARRILLRLTQPGEGTEDTRRRAPMSELVLAEGEEPAVREVVDRLVGERLLVLTTDEATGESAVEVTHEALIRGWPQLRAWIDRDRDNLRVHRRLTEAADEWRAANQDEGALYRGGRLAAWDGRTMTELNDRERAFLVASRTRAETERTTRRRRTRVIVGGLTVAAIAAAAGVGVGLTQSRQADAERAAAQSRGLANSSTVTRRADPELALLLASEAYRADHTPEAEAAFRQAAFESLVRGSLRSTGTVLSAVVSVSRDQVLVAGEDGSLRLWDIAHDPRGTATKILGHAQGGTVGLLDTPLGVVTATGKGLLEVWPTNGGRRRIVGNQPGASIEGLNATRDADVILASGTSGVWRWNLKSGRRKRISTLASFYAEELESGGTYAVLDDSLVLHLVASNTVTRVPVNGDVQNITLSPDRRYLAVGTGSRLQVWTAQSKPSLVSDRLVTDGVNGTAFSTDGRRIAVASGEGSVVVFPMPGGKADAVLRGHTGPLAAVTFVGNDRVVSVGTDKTARYWDWSHNIGTPIDVGPLPEFGGIRFTGPSAVTIVATSGAVSTWSPGSGLRRVLRGFATSIVSAAVSGDGRLIATGFEDGRVVVRTASGQRIGEWQTGGYPISLAMDAGGRKLLVLVQDGYIDEIAVGIDRAPRKLLTRESPPFVGAYSPSGDTVAAGFRDGSVIVFRDGPAPVAPVEMGSHDGPVLAMEFNRDGTTLATASADRTVRIWDVSANRLLHTLRGHAGKVHGLDFTDDGNRLVSAGSDSVRVWDWRREFLLATLPTQGAPLQVDSTGPGPTVAYYGGGTRVLVSKCDVCGSYEDVIKLVSERTSRDLTDSERAGYKITRAR